MKIFAFLKKDILDPLEYYEFEQPADAQTYLEQALQNARVLSTNMVAGTAQRSPWPARVDYRTGAVIPAFSPGELYGSVPELKFKKRKIYGDYLICSKDKK